MERAPTRPAAYNSAFVRCFAGCFSLPRQPTSGQLLPGERREDDRRITAPWLGRPILGRRDVL